MDIFGLGEAKTFTLYHGSQCGCVIPACNTGNPNNDYGIGFYLTPDRELACEWAVSRGFGKDGYLYQYSLDVSSLKIFNFERLEKFKVLHWIGTLLNHRVLDEEISGGFLDELEFLQKKFSVPVEQYDVVIGWRADDSYFSYARAFLQNQLNYSLLEECMTLADLGLQYCCKSQEAFRHLCPLQQTPQRISAEEYLPRFMRRDQEARMSYREILRSERNRYGNNLRIHEIINLYRK